MNRHGYKVRKFGRERDQRRALIKGLANELILHESIETTLPKAKAAAKYTEKLISKAKKAKSAIHLRRQLIASLSTLEAAHKLVDEISPKLEKRTSGYLSIKRTDMRRGDGTQMAKVSFVDDLKTAAKAAEPKKAEARKKDAPEEEAAQTTTNVTPGRGSKIQPRQTNQAARRTGRRGNR